MKDNFYIQNSVKNKQFVKMKKVYRGSAVRDNNDFLEANNFNIDHVIQQTKDRRTRMEEQIRENAKRLQKMTEEGGNYSDLKPFKELQQDNQLMWTSKYTIDYEEKEKLRKPKYIPYPWIKTIN